MSLVLLDDRLATATAAGECESVNPSGAVLLVSQRRMILIFVL